MEENYSELREIYSEQIIRVMCPELNYPCWEKWEIKRKYGKYPAIEIDVWQPCLKRPWDLLPKVPWTEWSEKRTEIIKNHVQDSLNKKLFNKLGVELIFA